MVTTEHSCRPKPAELIMDHGLMFEMLGHSVSDLVILTEPSVPTLDRGSHWAKNKRSAWKCLLASLVVISVIGCTDRNEPSAAPYEWRIIPNTYAKGFRIMAYQDLRRVVVFGAGGERDTVTDLILDLRQGEMNDAIDSTWIKVPLSRNAVMSTTHLSYFAALGRADAVVGGAYLDQVRDPIVTARLSLGTVELGTASGLDRERLIALAPEALWDYPFGRSSTTDRGVQGVPVIFVTEYLEPHPLGRAEWLRVFGLFLGKEREADSSFKAIERKYLTIAAQARSLPNAPSVFFGSTWQGQWYVPGADSYMATLIADAGGVYAFADHPGTENVAVDLETVIDRGGAAEHFGVVLAIPGPMSASVLAGGDLRIADLPALRERGFYGNSESSDLFGRAMLEPELILQDLLYIFHHQDSSEYRPSYFKPLDQ